MKVQTKTEVFFGGTISGIIIGLGFQLTSLKLQNRLSKSIAVGACLGLVTYSFREIGMRIKKNNPDFFQGVYEFSHKSITVPIAILILPYVAKHLTPIKLDTLIDHKVATIFVLSFYTLQNIFSFFNREK